MALSVVSFAVCKSFLLGQSEMKVTQSCLTLRPHGLYSPWNSPGQNTGVGSLSLFQGIFPTQGSNPTLQADSLPAEPQGKPKNAGEGSLSLLQRIFPTQESNQGLLCCRWILYQLNYQGTVGQRPGVKLLGYVHPQTVWDPWQRWGKVPWNGALRDVVAPSRSPSLPSWMVFP